MKNKLLFILIAFVSFIPAFAQQKIKDNTIPGKVLPNKDALLELESTNKGLLHARVQLLRTDDAAPLSQHRAGMMVYNTATANDVVPGIYYNNGNRWILVAGGDVTPITYNPVTYELTYIDVNGDTQVIHLEEVVKAVETVTALDYDSTEHILDYIDEDGVAHTVNLNVGTLAFDDQSNVLRYTAEDGVTTDIPLNNTSLSYDPALGRLRYVNTLGQLQEFNLSDVVDQLETVTSLNYDPATHVLTYIDEDRITHTFSLDVGQLAYDNPTNTLTYTAEDGTVLRIPLNVTDLTYSSATSVLTYVNSLGQTQTVDMTAIVKNLETLTTILPNADGTFSYTDEKGGTTTINIADLETLTKLALAGDDVNITYTDEKGDHHDIDMTAIVKNLETLTTLAATAVINGEDETIYRLIYTDESGNDNEIDITTTNALQIDGSSGAIKLGGELTEKTTIETNATNTLAITGLQNGDASQHNIIIADANGVLKKVSTNKFVRFFYMPSIVFDTSNPDPTGPLRTKDLYQEYVNQFTGAGTPGLIGSTGAPATIPYLPQPEDLYYYITYYDDEVFANLSIDENGLLSYRVIGPGTPTSFMNIVFVIKE